MNAIGSREIVGELKPERGEYNRPCPKRTSGDARLTNARKRLGLGKTTNKINEAKTKSKSKTKTKTKPNNSSQGTNRYSQRQMEANIFQDSQKSSAHHCAATN
jgi:hypothetical protein